jgi:hypothetical protein
MHILALSFTAHKTLRVEELAGALAALAGAAILIGGLMPFGRRFGMIAGGLLLAASGVVFLLAVRYGVRP